MQFTRSVSSAVSLFGKIAIFKPITQTIYLLSGLIRKGVAKFTRSEEGVCGFVLRNFNRLELLGSVP